MDTRYAAGFFDGEGCIHIARNIRVILSGCFRPGLLEQFSIRWGGKIFHKVNTRPNQRNGVRWEITGTKAAVFLEDLLPFLYEKHDQAVLALEYQRYKRSLNVRGGKGYSPEQREVFVDIERRIRQMKTVEHSYRF